MSVFGIEVIQIVPIMQENRANRRTPAIVGRWHAGGDLMGDASGGIYQHSFVWQGVSGVLGKNWLWDIRSISLYSANGAMAAGVTTEARVHSAEPSGGVAGQGFNIHGVIYWDQQLRVRTVMYSVAEMPLYLMGINRNALLGIGSSIIYLNTTPNTNGFSISAYASGYIYDEEYL